MPLLASAPEFVPASSVHPTSQQPDHLMLRHDSSNMSQQLPGNSTTGVAQASLHAQPFQQNFSTPAHLPAVNSMSASTQAPYHPRPLQQSLPAPVCSPTVDSTTALAQALQDTMTLNRLQFPSPVSSPETPCSLLSGKLHLQL